VSELVAYVEPGPFWTLIPPTLKLNNEPPDAVKVTGVPAQNELSASLLDIDAAGSGLTVFAIPEEIEEHELPSITITVTTWLFVSDVVV
jgi:hypothetical protein